MKNIKDFMIDEAKASTKFGKGTFEDLGTRIASHLNQLENVNVKCNDYVKTLFDSIFANVDDEKKDQFTDSIKKYLNV